MKSCRTSSTSPKRTPEKSGGSFRITHDMADAFKDADVVYPKSWAPFAAMEKRT
jgi:ornithine carbamoyltransferase